MFIQELTFPLETIEDILNVKNFGKEYVNGFDMLKCRVDKELDRAEYILEQLMDELLIEEDQD